MAASTFEVDPELLLFGADSSQFASDSARTAADKLNESTAPRGIFGDFDAAHSFSGALAVGRDEHVQRLLSHQRTLGDIAGKAHLGAQRVVETDSEGARTLSAVRNAM